MKCAENNDDEIELIMKLHRLHECEVECLSVSKAQKTLGAYLAPDGSNENRFHAWKILQRSGADK